MYIKTKDDNMDAPDFVDCERCRIESKGKDEKYVFSMEKVSNTDYTALYKCINCGSMFSWRIKPFPKPPLKVTLYDFEKP